MSLAQPLELRVPPHNANRSYAKQISTENAEELTETLLDTPEKEKFPQLPLPHSGLNLKSALKITLVLILATSYLTFCVIAYYRPIPIDSGVLGLSFIHFNIASGITTIAILIIYVALWPIKGLVDEIRSEEFFRLLRTYPKGVSLDSVNAISVPTTGTLDIALATFRHHCSPLLTSTLITTLLIVATSVLAPAALNAASILIDIVDPAFQIGAIPNSFCEVVEVLPGSIHINMAIPDLLPLASTVSWVEDVLNLSTTYSKVISSEDDPLASGYIVPLPLDYTPAMQAQWITDIIVFDPSCNWRAPNATGLFEFNSTETREQNVTLLETKLSIQILSDYFSSGHDEYGKTSVGILSSYSDSTALDGSTIFVVSQLEPTGPGGGPLPEVTIPQSLQPQIKSQPYPNLSQIHTLPVSNGDILAFLVCSPNASIQTRQVWATGNGSLTLGQHQRSQGNLDLSQVNCLLSIALADFATSSGPVSIYLGTDMMIRLIFGNIFEGNNPPSFSNIQPAPLSNITNVYKQIIQSATKVFLSGAIGWTNVTGGLSKEQVVFKSSLGHVIASAILFALLTTGLVVAQFRKGRDAFALVDVAAALADSDAPQKFVEMKQRADAEERRILELVQSGKGDWIVRLKASTED